MADTFQYDVFLSHSAKDNAVVRPLADWLRQDGLKVWFDEWVLKAGDSIPAKIDPPTLRSYGGTGEGLEQSRVLACPAEASARRRTRPAIAYSRRRMLCVSAKAFGSDWAQLLPCFQHSTLNSQPSGAPLYKERRFIPLRLDDAPIKGSLAYGGQFACARQPVLVTSWRN